MGFAYSLVSKQEPDPCLQVSSEDLLTTGGERLGMVRQEQEVGCGQGRKRQEQTLWCTDPMCSGRFLVDRPHS